MPILPCLEERLSFLCDPPALARWEFQTRSGNTFGLAGKMIAFNEAPLSYDLNGNLTNDSTNTYTCDARNHLVGLSGSGTLPTTASFVYDAVGRRAAKTLAAAPAT